MPRKKSQSYKIPSKSELLQKIRETGGPSKSDVTFANGKSFLSCCWYVCDTGQCSHPCAMVEQCTRCWDTKTPTK